jgi:hypothetical protein
MSVEQAPQRARLRRYLTKNDVRQRYGWKTVVSVDRAVKIYGTLPLPTTYQGRHPLWAEHLLDAHDDRSQESSFAPEHKAASAQRAKRMHQDGKLRKQKRAAKARARS